MTTKSERARVHRFGDSVAVYVPEAQETVYLPAVLAERLAVALARCAEDIRDRPKFSESEFPTTEVPGA